MIQISFYARYQELMGMKTFQIDFSGTLTDLLKRGEFTRIPPDAIITIDRKVASGSEYIDPNSEVAFLPPVSGG